MYGLHSIGGYEVGELLKRYADLIGMEIDTLMYAFTCSESCILMEAEASPTPLMIRRRIDNLICLLN